MRTHTLHRDFETRSAAPLEVVGAWRYAADVSTQILLIGYAVDNGPVRIWRPGEPIPKPFIAAARDSNWLTTAHNDQFESAIETHVLRPRFDWPCVPLERHRCTMAAALASALPAALDNAAAALGLTARKDPAGHRLMLQMSKPRAANQDDDDAEAERLHRLATYCQGDVEIERELFHRLPALIDSEQALWVLDQQINARGFYIDRKLARAAQKLTREEQAAIDAELAAVTNGAVTTVNQVARITAYLEDHGHHVTSLKRRNVSAVLARGPDDNVRRVLELRRSGARASARKFTTLFAGLDADDRLRGTLRYHGAGPGRWTGSRFQPQNLPRGSDIDPDAAVVAIMTGKLAVVRKIGSPLQVIGDSGRALICAAPGRELMVGDFSTIEPRTLSWLATERWKLDMFRRFDTSQDPALDPYLLIASKMLHRPVSPDDTEARQHGKCGELACGFGGSVGAWTRIAPDDDRSDAVIKADVMAWRRAHPRTTKFWRDIDRGVRRAIRFGVPVQIGRLTAEFENGTLRIILPSGRAISYPQAQIVPGRYGSEVAFMDNAKGAWCQARAWFGVFVENCVQGIARDLLAAALQRLEAAGYPIVLHCHDEAVSEVPKGFGNLAEFSTLMTTAPEWAAGLPITAKVRSGPRYAKSNQDQPGKPRIRKNAPKALLGTRLPARARREGDVAEGDGAA
jgi:DNA polymerase